MKTITVWCTWESRHEIEVPDDFQDTGHLTDFPKEALEELSSHTAALIDWSVS